MKGPLSDKEIIRLQVSTELAMLVKVMGKAMKKHPEWDKVCSDAFDRLRSRGDDGPGGWCQEPEDIQEFLWMSGACFNLWATVRAVWGEPDLKEIAHLGHLGEEILGDVYTEELKKDLSKTHTATGKGDRYGQKQ